MAVVGFFKNISSYFQFNPVEAEPDLSIESFIHDFENESGRALENSDVLGPSSRRAGIAQLIVRLRYQQEHLDEVMAQMDLANHLSPEILFEAYRHSIAYLKNNKEVRLRDDPKTQFFIHKHRFEILYDEYKNYQLIQ